MRNIDAETYIDYGEVKILLYLYYNNILSCKTVLSDKRVN